MDLKEFTLSFVINDRDYGVADDVAKHKVYCLGVSLLCQDSQITLYHFVKGVELLKCGNESLFLTQFITG